MASSSLLEIVSPKFIKYCPILGTKRKKISNNHLWRYSCYLSCYTSTHEFIWHRYGDMAPQR